MSNLDKCKRSFVAKLTVYDWDTMSKKRRSEFLVWLKDRLMDFADDSRLDEPVISKRFTARLMK
jgi:hypothetical protein